MREERRVVSALFADLVGSTALVERLDPEDARDIVGGAIARMIRAVEAFEGTVKDLAGDGLVALFGAPIAHEDDQERAVRAGLAIVDDLGSFGDEVSRRWGVEGLSVRVGIETGVAVLGPFGAGGRVEYGATGDALNTAARLQAAAVPGTVLVGAGTQRGVEKVFEWGEPHDFDLKGKAEPVVAFLALRVRTTPTRARGLEGVDARLVGRRREVELARRAMNELLAGRGGVLFVTGEAGLGKSRMIAELEAMLESAGREGGRWLEGHCVSYGGNLPYWPYRDLLLTWIARGRANPVHVLKLALRARVEELLDAHASEVVPYVTALLGVAPDPPDDALLAALSPEALQYRTFEAVRTLIRALADRQPVALALDDLHWADPTSLQLTERLLPLTEEVPLLLVVAMRSDRDRRSWRLVQDGLARPGARAASIALGSLGQGEDRELLELLVGAGTLPPGLERRLLETAEGNPFFLEELVRSLIDAGAIVREDESWRFDHDVVTEVPQTVEKVILARIDRLPLACRDVLTAASVVGRQFELSLLRAVMEIDPEPALTELLDLDLLREERAASRTEYRFKHVLIQESAYGTLLRKRRRELHRRAARALETLMTDRPEVRFGLLAHHYRKAGDLAEALTNHRRAAETAGRLYAVAEALDHYTAALNVASELGIAPGDHEVTSLLMERGRVAAHRGDTARAEEDFRTALTGARAGGDQSAEMWALDELGFVLAGAADYGASIPLLEEALRLAVESGNRHAEVEILSRLSIVHTNQVRFDLAARYGEWALALARDIGEEPDLATAMDALKQVALDVGDLPTLRATTEQLEASCRRRGDLWRLQFVVFESAFVPMAAGRWEEAVERVGEALEVCRGIDDRGNEPIHLGALCWFERARGRYGHALDAGRRAVAAASEIGHLEWTAWASAALGWTFQDLLFHEEAAKHLRAGVEAAQRAGAHLHLLRCLAHVAWSEWQLSQPEQAAIWADRAQAALEEVTVPAGRAFLLGSSAHVALARVRLAQGDPTWSERMLSPVVAAAEASGWTETGALGAVVLGDCRLAQGDAAGAASLLRRALALAERSGLRGVEWEAHVALARVARSQGRSDEADAHLTRARSGLAGLSPGIDDLSIRDGFLERAEAALGTVAG